MLVVYSMFYDLVGASNQWKNNNKTYFILALFRNQYQFDIDTQTAEFLAASDKVMFFYIWFLVLG